MMAVAALPRVWATAAQMDEHYPRSLPRQTEQRVIASGSTGRFSALRAWPGSSDAIGNIRRGSWPQWRTRPHRQVVRHTNSAFVRDQDIDPTHSATRPTIASTACGAQLRGSGKAMRFGTAYG